MNLLWRAILSVGGGSVIVGSGPAWAGACASSSFFCWQSNVELFCWVVGIPCGSFIRINSFEGYLIFNIQYVIFNI